MKDFYRIELAAMDEFDIAVARFDCKGELTYLNAAGKKLLGAVKPGTVDLRMLFPDPAEYELVTRELKTRLDGKSSAYISTFRRLDEPTHPPIPVRIYAFPDSDTDGTVTGSVALIRDLREEQVRAGIHAAIQASVDNEQLFTAVARQLQTLFEFDEFRVTTISKSRLHMRRLYSSDAQAGAKYPFRWWPMPPFVQKTLAARRAGVTEVCQMIADPNYAELLKTDSALLAFLNSGVRQILSFPIMQDNQIVAFVGLDSRRDGRYTQEAADLLARLPVAEAAMAAIHREQHDRQQVVFDLTRGLGAMADDVKRVAGKLVSRLVESFGWDHVSIFQREDGTDTLLLLCQANSNGVSLPDNCVISCADSPPQRAAPGGALARAALSNQVINTPGTRLEGPFAASPAFSGAGSQLAVPIAYRRAAWVLNVESRQTNAFAAEEIELLELLAREVGSVLHRSALFELNTTVLRSINDAVIETNTAGDIRWCNTAATRLLGIEPATGAVIKMLDLVTDQQRREQLPPEGNFSHCELELRATSGRAVPVLLSASELPDHLGGRVFVATDFTFQKELQRLSELREVFSHAAMEGRVPLSLASIWLQQWAAGDSPLPTPDAVNQVLRQLARADLPLERLLRLFSLPPDAVARCEDFGLALETTLSELPPSLADVIETTRPGVALPVRADFNDLQFCIESIISFALRTRPQSMHLQLWLARQNRCAILRVEGNWLADVGNASVAGSPDRWRRKTLIDLTLGESIIERVVEQAGGTYSCQLEPRLKFMIELPLQD
jgi:PAS domain-containing protein